MVAWETASRWINSWWNLCEYVPASRLFCGKWFYASLIQRFKLIISWLFGTLLVVFRIQNQPETTVQLISFQFISWEVLISSRCLVFAHTHTHLKKEMFSAWNMNFSMPSSPSQEPSWNINVQPSMWHCQSSRRWLKLKHGCVSASEFPSCFLGTDPTRWDFTTGSSLQQSRQHLGYVEGRWERRE